MQRNRGGTQGRGVKMKPAGKKPPEKSATDKPLAGRIFYLDVPSKVLSEKLEKDIKALGGTVEGFLSKEISCLITSKKEAKSSNALKYSCTLSSPEPVQNKGAGSTRTERCREESQAGSSKKKPGMDDASRGKSLLKKVMKEQERLPRNSILANAWNWGVRILHVDAAKLYIEDKKKSQQAKKTEVAPKQVRKRRPRAEKLRSPYIKVDDCSGKYRPLVLTLPTFRSFQPVALEENLTVENKAPTAKQKKGSKKTAQNKETNPKVDVQEKGGYCECCLEKYDNLLVHVISRKHKKYANGPNYKDVDELISMFNCDLVDWSVKIQEVKSLVPTLNPLWKEKEIAEPPSSQEDCPLESILTKLNIPLDAASADADCRAITNPDPLPMDSIFSLQTLDNTGRVADSFTLPPGAANHLAFSGSPAPAAETTNVCDENCKRKVSTAIQKCSSEPDIDCSIKKIKLDSSLESVTLLSAPVDANDVARRKPVLYTVPKGLNTTCPSNTLHAQSDPSSSSSPSKLHRKVKRLSRKARKKTSQAAPSCKVSAPVEQYDVSSSKQRILSLFETSDMQSEFCGFSSKSANLPQSMDVKDDQPSSKGDFDWCIFATTSSSAETFHGF
ncbi:protein DBF4 homolog A isoform X1 [Pyxicephalus adspersus]|uniref:Protein DBF4 homolog A n=1 Tax=Pyxicephalus adspersus TaxID=30357 RepID=A0AAV3AE28_PYXAD|nr:TPA: hypothetical protein GDO54_012755 [Pyxicephalus adspersus]